MRRHFDPAELELMDRPQPVSSELEQDLRSIRQLNRWFGSHRLVRRFVRCWIKPGDNVRVVDLASGSGDIPRLIVDCARKIGTRVEIIALDRQSATLEIARKLSGDYPEISFIEADILKFKPSDGYDLVLCSLALHHFSDEDAVRVLQRCARFRPAARLARHDWSMSFDCADFSRANDAARRAAFNGTGLFLR
ncbi:MAG: hypothetical protein DME72_00470 [Verrucomicrobia bacterium]|nr:MAG: hypothetical protein DME72_00470 [Verrucomicrobiota bacterium]